MSRYKNLKLTCPRGWTGHPQKRGRSAQGKANSNGADECSLLAVKGEGGVERGVGTGRTPGLTPQKDSETLHPGTENT